MVKSLIEAGSVTENERVDRIASVGSRNYDLLITVNEISQLKKKFLLKL